MTTSFRDAIIHTWGRQRLLKLIGFTLFGVFIARILFNAPIEPNLFVGAALPPIALIVTANILKRKQANEQKDSLANE